MRNNNFNLALIFGLVLQLQLVACSASDTSVISWPISDVVNTTVQKQILPIAVPLDAPLISPGDVSKYEQYGYSAWQAGDGLPYVKRTDLAPSYVDAASSARLLNFFTITDIHISDKESPAQPIYIGLSAPYGPSSAGLISAYSPCLLSTTHVLDAAVQTINALHERTPFDFGISLGDNINNSQYNELRWFIDVMDGKIITPSSGDHLGASDIDYQKPYKAAGLNPEIPWYQTLGNHDQFWMGSSYENTKTLNAHIGSAILNMRNDTNPASNAVNDTGAYMGVVDGTTPYGDIIGAGAQEDFTTAPTVVADENRHSLATDSSTSLSWMTEFFSTTSTPIGHGFTQANLDNDFASYTFEPSANIPIKVIVLDDTCKGVGQLNYAAGCLDQTRIDWLTAELQKGQDDGKLMIISAHIPVHPQTYLEDDGTHMRLFRTPEDATLITTLHNYPNLLLWISGHRHLNTITPQPYNASDLNDHPENSFWEVETASLKDFPQNFRTLDIRRNSDNTISTFVTDVDPAVLEGSPAAKSRGYAIGAERIYAGSPEANADTTSRAYNAELIKQLTPEMATKIANYGIAIE